MKPKMSNNFFHKIYKNFLKKNVILSASVVKIMQIIVQSVLTLLGIMHLLVNVRKDTLK